MLLVVSANLSRLEGDLEEIKANQLVLNKTIDSTLQKLIEYETQMLYYFNKTTISNNRIVDDFSNITQTINELQKSRNKINDTLNCSVHRQSIANLEITMIEIARVSKCHLAILQGYFEKISPFIVWLLLHQIFNRRASITSFLQYDPILQWHCGRMAESWVLECVSTTNVLQNLPSQITQTL